MHRRTVVVSLLAIALLAWFLRGANLLDVWKHVQQARGDLLLASLLAVLVNFAARSIRWRYLLAPVGPARFATLFKTTVIGFGALAVLPARLGDLIRPYLLAKREGLPFPSVGATIVIERLLDLLTVLLLLAVYVWGFATRSSLPAAVLRPIEISAAISAAIAITLLGVMWLAAGHPERIGSMVSAVARVLPGRMSERVGGLASAFSGGFAAIRNGRMLCMALLWSIPVWLAVAAQAWLVTVAFGIAMPFAGTFLLEAILLVGVAVPTPGAVGSFHEAYRIGVTTFFGASNDAAVAAAIVTHAFAFAPAVIGGILFMAQDGLSFGNFRDLSASAQGQGQAIPQPASAQMPRDIIESIET
jgi:glycosyltransferase 2 family protein